MTKHQSHYDPNRETIGKIYRDLQLNPSKTLIEVGDMSNSMLPGLVEDINQAFKEGTKDFDGRPFYVLIHEKKDLQMKSALLRRVFKQLWRPWPEDDTTVFWHDPKAFETRFCWSLPHWSEMDNMLAAKELYEPALIAEVQAWKRFDLYQFGFRQNNEGHWEANPHFKDKPLDSFNKAKRIV